MRSTLLLILLSLFCGCALAPTGHIDSHVDGRKDGNNDVRIVRDNYGVPHVYADTVYGLYYGYGHAIAQDRLFQMEMARRSTQGQVAEVLGGEYVDYDTHARRLFSPQSIRTQLSALAPADRDVFEGYAAGLNSWLAIVRRNPETLLPKQFHDLEFTPDDWTAFDVAMIFIGTMNNRYGDFNTELENAAIYRSLAKMHGEAEARSIFNWFNPRYTKGAPTTIPVSDWSRDSFDSLAGQATRNWPALDNGQASLSPTLQSSGFSNCYVIGKEKTDGESAILVNGPQFGWFVPSYVYSIGLHGAGIDVVGNTPFGYPMIMFGHNRTIAWGSTWGASDIVDIYEERLHPDDASRYLHKGEYLAFDSRDETIRVKGGDDVNVTLYRSVHGPVLSMDHDAGIAHAKKRAWDGRELETLLSWLYATWADDFEAWKQQAEKSAINVNMYFADVDGNIGYFHGGQFPRRVAGHDNRFPATGDGSMEWQGRQSTERANPHTFNSSTGFLANWNNKPAEGVMNPDFFFYSWSQADRVDYLNDALAAKESFTPDEAWALLETSSHADVLADYLVPRLLEAIKEDPDLAGASALLQEWDRHSRDNDNDGFYDQRATAVFRTFVSELIQLALEGRLPADVYPYFSASGYPAQGAATAAGTNIQTGTKAILEVIFGNSDDKFLATASVDELLRDALRRALKKTNELMPAAERPFHSRNFLGIPQAGEDEAMQAPLEQNRGTENNMIVMRRDAIVGWEVAPPGQSGFISPAGERSPHFDDQFEMYHTFGRKRMWFYTDDVEANAQTETVLTY